MDFESRIMVKYDAAKLLRKRLNSPGWDPETVVMSGVTDPYQPVERELRITRACLMVFEEFLNPVSIITKNYLVTRDLELLKKMASHNAVHVTLSVTTLDRDLARLMEPRTSQPGRRLEAIRTLSNHGISVGVNVAPIIPGLTDHECVNILEAAKEAGARYASYTIVRLPYSVKEMFSDWLEHHFPDRKDKVLNRIRSMRDGVLNESQFGKRFHGEGAFAEQIRNLFKVHTKRLGYNKQNLSLNTNDFRPGKGSQLNLFSENEG